MRRNYFDLYLTAIYVEANLVGDWDIMYVLFVCGNTAGKSLCMTSFFLIVCNVSDTVNFLCF